MKHYNNHHSSSRTYYKDLQRNSSKNLNSSNNKLDKTELYLERFLSVTYKYLSPIFEDNEVMTSFKNDTTNNYIDEKVDEKITQHTPSWIQSLATFFIQLYEELFPKPSKNKTINRIKHFTKFTNKSNVSHQRITNNFALNKASP